MGDQLIELIAVSGPGQGEGDDQFDGPAPSLTQVPWASIGPDDGDAQGPAQADQMLSSNNGPGGDGDDQEWDPARPPLP
jgi:hypothetical protein